MKSLTVAMKSMEFGLQKSQHWYLHGLKPMHRALVRRIADQVAAEASISLIWHLSTEMPTIDAWFQPETVGVVWIDRELWLSQSSSIGWSFDRVREPLRSWTASHIRLLWSWDLPSSDMEWGLGVGFAGVISSVSCLRAWCRAAVVRGTHVSVQPNALLRDLNVPCIAL